MALRSNQRCPSCGSTLEITMNRRVADRHYYCRTCDAHYAAFRIRPLNGSLFPREEPPVGERMKTWSDD